jgi:general secretion pathway protein K
VIKKRNQQGAAIIVALFLTALVAAMAVAMMERFRTDTRRTELLLNANQANFYAQGSVVWAKDQLITNWKNQQPNRIIDKTPIRSTNQQNNALIVNTIEDAQGFFNLNNLSDSNYQASLVQLIKVVSPKTDPATAQAIALGIVDWISPGIKGSAFDRFYAEQNPPYLAPHRPMVSISELRLVKGMTPELFNALSPFITALPNPTPININNTAAPILMSLSNTLTPTSAAALMAYAQKTPFTSTQQFLNFEIVKNNPIPENKITVTSNFFLVKSEITIGQQHLLLYTLLQRLAKDKDAIVIVLWQTKGTL